MKPDFDELVIGSLLQTQGQGMSELSLIPDDFSEPWWWKAFAVMQDQWQAKKFFDVFTVCADVPEKVFRERIMDAWQLAFYPFVNTDAWNSSPSPIHGYNNLLHYTASASMLFIFLNNGLPVMLSVFVSITHTQGLAFQLSCPLMCFHNS
jgi:hypothetical protein